MNQFNVILFPSTNSPLVSMSFQLGQIGVKVVGRLPDVSERFYAISVERRLTHPAVVAMTQQARTALFHDEQPRG